MSAGDSPHFGHSRKVDALTLVAFGSAACSAVIGGASFLARAIPGDSPYFTGLLTVRPPVAVAFLLAALSFYLQHDSKSRQALRLARAAALLVVFIGIVFSIPVNLRLQREGEGVPARTSYSTRTQPITPYTSLTLVLVGFALYLRTRKSRLGIYLS